MFGMPAKKVRSNRKRSRPIEPKKMNSHAKYIAVAVLVIVVIIASVLILLYANSGNNQTQTEANPVAVSRVPTIWAHWVAPGATNPPTRQSRYSPDR